MKCDFCKKRGSSFYIALHLEQQIPEEISRFKVLVSLSFYHSVIECPDCHTIFDQRRVIDNEPCNSSDDVEFKEISAVEARELVDYMRKAKRKFSRKIDLKIKDLKQDLTTTELAIIDVFKKKMLEKASINEVKESVENFDEDAFNAAFAALVTRGVLKQSNCYGIVDYYFA